MYKVSHNVQKHVQHQKLNMKPQYLRNHLYHNTRLHITYGTIYNDISSELIQ